MADDTSRTTGLERHILDTYFLLRLGMGFLALAFPLVLWIGGELLVSTSLQESMSTYYHTGMRNVFVGVLFAIGSFLLLYKGFTPHEDWALNFAAVFAIGVAVFPMNVEWSVGCGIDCGTLTEACPCLESRFKPFTAGRLHGACAVLFFVAIGYVSIVLSRETLYLVKNKQHRMKYRYAYGVLGWAMILLPVMAWALFTFAHLGVPGSQNYSIFFVEFAGVWVFAAYWLIKTYELSSTNADQRFLPAKLRPKEET